MPANHPCDRLFNDILETFERIARGASPNCADVLVKVLLDYGLVRPTVRVIDRDSLGPIVRHGYSLSSDVRSEMASSLS
ncbi:hypothetical protein IQ16_03692 [Bradyrhizobium huanghuaihaiense]|uniref:Uncharacterized protein n=1 Tax=Bradyrhizobium huanghuaihaiense TaxID=990078 RepID=A0A562RNB7_9BRAD|nr:hypothetical protein [Bradyrhizobium huanghuaihaiense]TWI70519.1 hypothetical protein IQ16_03692 [Bradyrhizobium huanghuaihaiense]